MMAGSDTRNGSASVLTERSGSCARRANRARRVGSESAAKVRSRAVSLNLTMWLRIGRCAALSSRRRLLRRKRPWAPAHVVIVAAPGTCPASDRCDWRNVHCSAATLATIVALTLHGRVVTLIDVSCKENAACQGGCCARVQGALG